MAYKKRERISAQQKTVCMGCGNGSDKTIFLYTAGGDGGKPGSGIAV